MWVYEIYSVSMDLQRTVCHQTHLIISRGGVWLCETSQHIIHSHCFFLCFRTCFFTVDSITCKSRFMQQLNNTFRSGGMSTSFNDSQFLSFIQYLKGRQVQHCQSCTCHWSTEVWQGVGVGAAATAEPDGGDYTKGKLHLCLPG